MIHNKVADVWEGRGGKEGPEDDEVDEEGRATDTLRAQKQCTPVVKWVRITYALLKELESVLMFTRKGIGMITDKLESGLMFTRKGIGMITGKRVDGRGVHFKQV